MTTKILSAEFIKGVLGTDDILTDGIPQVAFIGRSNVGKSSVINSLTNRKDLAKSSSTPGKTQQINFFRIRTEPEMTTLFSSVKDRPLQKIYFVDLPGYGFAKLSKERREKLRKMIMWYFAESGADPSKVVLIIDAKVGPSDFDIEMVKFLKELNLDLVVVANKSDKLNQSARIKNLKSIRNLLMQDDVILYSAKTKYGLESLLKELINNNQ
jgi:GTP-binding protein